MHTTKFIQSEQEKEKNEQHEENRYNKDANLRPNNTLGRLVEYPCVATG
jgi:hypothetical protein